MVLDHPMINAFALPGGYVVFFRGLIEAAQAPEEVCGGVSDMKSDMLSAAIQRAMLCARPDPLAFWD